MPTGHRCAHPLWGQSVRFSGCFLWLWAHQRRSPPPTSTGFWSVATPPVFRRLAAGHLAVAVVGSGHRGHRRLRGQPPPRQGTAPLDQRAGGPARQAGRLLESGQGDAVVYMAHRYCRMMRLARPGARARCWARHVKKSATGLRFRWTAPTATGSTQPC